MDGENVGLRQQLVERHSAAARVEQHAHPESLRAPRHRASDAAITEDAQGALPQVAPEEHGRRPAAELARPHHPLAFAHAPREREDQRPGQIGRRVGEHVRGIGHPDAAGGAGRDVDVVVSDSVIGDDAQPRGGLEQLLVHAVSPDRQQRRGLAHPPQQLAALHRLLRIVHVDLDARSQDVLGSEHEPAGDEDARLLHPPCVPRWVLTGPGQGAELRAC